MHKILFLLIFYILIIFSTFGYGLLSINLLNKNGFKHFNTGLIGIYGIFSLIFISYLTNLFFSHSLIHNSIILIIGLISYFFFIFVKKIKLDFKIVLFIFGFLFIALLIFKNHDDFHYYHFPYTLNIIQDKIQFGMGHFGHGFRTPSSIFYLNSLFYLPIINFNLLNLGQLLIWGFVNLILVKEIMQKKDSINKSFLFFLSLFSFVFINIFFYRLAEHGTDRSAQILIFLLIIFILDFINLEKYSKEKLENIIIILIIIISLKAFYILYFLFLIQLILKIYEFKLKIREFIKSKLTIGIALITVILFFNANFSNSGCIVYPVKDTCLDSLEWSLEKDKVSDMNNWYELWSKAGATPNSRVDNPQEYIQKFNWVSNWINEYFFNKVFDTILGIIFIIIIFVILFYEKIKVKNKKNFKFLFIYLLLFTLFFEWFYNHPSLRYGGFSLLALLFFLPICKYLSSFDINKKRKNRLVYTLFIITVCIFTLRNIDRLYAEYTKYNYNPIINPYYTILENGYRIDIKLKKLKIESKECKLINNCNDKDGVKLKNINNYNFFYNN